MSILRPRRCQGERGSAIVEFALISSFLILLLMVTFDYGRIFFTSIGITSAANGLALYAYTKTTDGKIPSELDSDKKAEDLARKLFEDNSLSATQAVLSCKCPTDTNYTACQNPLQTCAGSNKLRIAIKVTASADFKTAVNYPGIPNKTTIARQAIIRVQ